MEHRLLRELFTLFHSSHWLIRLLMFPIMYNPDFALVKATHIRFSCFQNPVSPLVLCIVDSITISHSVSEQLSTEDIFMFLISNDSSLS